MKKALKHFVTPPDLMAGTDKSKRFENSPLFDLTINNFPIAVWGGPEGYDPDRLIRSDRIVQLVNKLGLDRESYFIENVFNTDRLDHWIRKNTDRICLNGVMRHGFVLPKTVDKPIELLMRPDNFYAKLDNNIFYLEHREEFTSNGDTRSLIVFIGKDWTVKKIKKFILKFSKDLYELWTKDHASDGDPTAFDSIFLPDNVIKDIREDIEAFLHSRKMYEEELKLSWKRGYMLIGGPGNGKTLLIRNICKYYGLEHFDIKNVIDQRGNVSMDKAIDITIDNLLYPDEEKPKVCILEDIDKFTAFQGGEANDRDYGEISLHSLLKGLDGVDGFSDIILIATSNFPDVLHEALVGRPGRFDKIYRVEKPTKENIIKLLNYYKITVKDGTIDFIADKLLGGSMAFVAEFVKLVKMKTKRNEITVEEAQKALKSIENHKKLCEQHFKEEKKIGFKG